MTFRSISYVTLKVAFTEITNDLLVPKNEGTPATYLVLSAALDTAELSVLRSLSSAPSRHPLPLLLQSPLLLHVFLCPLVLGFLPAVFSLYMFFLSGFILSR